MKYFIDLTGSFLKVVQWQPQPNRKTQSFWSKQRAPMAKLARCDHWVLAGTPTPKIVGFCYLVGVAIAPVSKKLAVKGFSRKVPL